MTWREAARSWGVPEAEFETLMVERRERELRRALTPFERTSNATAGWWMIRLLSPLEQVPAAPTPLVPLAPQVRVPLYQQVLETDVTDEELAEFLDGAGEGLSVTGTSAVDQAGSGAGQVGAAGPGDDDEVESNDIAGADNFLKATADLFGSPHSRPVELTTEAEKYLQSLYPSPMPNADRVQKSDIRRLFYWAETDPHSPYPDIFKNIIPGQHPEVAKIASIMTTYVANLKAGNVAAQAGQTKKFDHRVTYQLNQLARRIGMVPVFGTKSSMTVAGASDQPRRDWRSLSRAKSRGDISTAGAEFLDAHLPVTGTGSRANMRSMVKGLIHWVEKKKSPPEPRAFEAPGPDMPRFAHLAEEYKAAWKNGEVTDAKGIVRPYRNDIGYALDSLAREVWGSAGDAATTSGAQQADVVPGARPKASVPQKKAAFAKKRHRGTTAQLQDPKRQKGQQGSPSSSPHSSPQG
jgi:hypothetical protein